MQFLLPVLVLAGLFAALSSALIVAEKLLINYGVCTVNINCGERTLEIEGGGTLLSALYSEDIFIPSACGGRGSCAYCKVRVLSGGGPLLATEAPYLTRAERRADVRLACQVKVREDMQISMPEEYLNVRLFESVVESTRSLTHDIKEILLRLIEPQEIEFRAGQYVQVQAPSPQGPVFRAYSISNPPSQKGLVELIVRLVPGGIGSTYLHNLKVDDPVTFAGPFGHFRLQEDVDTELVCVGGGCGMAPIKSLVLSTLEQWPERECWLFFGCRGTGDIFYLQEFEKLAEERPNFHVVYALSDKGPDEQWSGETGFIHLSADKHLEPGGEKQAFLCGPPPMIEAVTEVLKDKGLEEDDVFYDKF